MAGVNKVILVGRLGADPEIRYTPSGAAVANFTLATSENWKDKDGNKQEKTEWHKIVVFSKLAEICGQYLNKGKQIYIEGRIQTRQWEDRDGNKKYTTEIVANQMQMLGSPGQNQNQNQNQSAPANAGNAPRAGENDPPELDDIPF